MPSVIERLNEALNSHDLEAFLDCFGPEYQSEQPAHPNRGFGGREQVRKNWSSIFENFPDLEARLLRHTAEGDTSWSEWRWNGTGLDMAGVIVLGIENERIVWGRLYMEPVEEAGGDIDETVRQINEGTLRQKS